MKRIFSGVLALGLCAVLQAHGQDSATEERINKLNGRIDDLISAQESIRKQLSELSREVSKELGNVREQASKPNSSYASQDDLRKLADKLKEVDSKRIDDYEKIHGEIVSLGKSLQTPAPAPHNTTRPNNQKKDSPKDKDSDTAKKPEEGYEYVIKKDDTLSVIAAAYKEKGVKITPDQIVKANKGLDPNRMKVGQKIFIPAAP